MLKIKDNVDLKELEKFGFEYYWEIKQNNTSEKYCNGYKVFTEKGYRIGLDGNAIEVVEERKNANWFFPNEEREIYVFETDYDMGVSNEMLNIIYDLISAGLVEKVGE